MMKYTESKKNEWVKTIQNYLMSKALEMKHYLAWAESFQSHVITDDLVRVLSTSGVCSDHDPLRISFGLGDT